MIARQGGQTIWDDIVDFIYQRPELSSSANRGRTLDVLEQGMWGRPARVGEATLGALSQGGMHRHALLRSQRTTFFT